ncbi:dUTP diphosphatase [Bacillus halotolerans]|uniref:dUTP diphosphatase n=1 Tax=Bacillus halotolerans TaxID=260554 RepID=UPI003990AE14
MNVNIKRLSPDAQIPAYAHATDAGFDLVAASDVIIEPGETACVPTGLAFEIPEGYEMQIRPRSGITLKTKLRVQLGTVYAGYRGEVGVIVDNIAQKIGEEDTFYNLVDGYWEETEKAEFFDFELDDYRHGSVFVPENTYIIRKGDRLAQAVIKPVEQAVFMEVDALGDSDRGAGGFGSSGVIAESYKKANERNSGALERLAKEETHLESTGIAFDLPKEDA